jgi:hypothetical protein
MKGRGGWLLVAGVAALILGVFVSLSFVEQRGARGTAHPPSEAADATEAPVPTAPSALPVPAETPAPQARPEVVKGATEPAVVRGRVMGRYGTILGVPVRVLVHGVTCSECRTDVDGRYRLEAPGATEFDLEATPEPWTELKPMRRHMTIDAGAEVVEDLVFAPGAGASGRILGPGVGARVTLFAINVRDYPPAPDGFVPAPDLRDVPKVVAEACGTFTFTGLDPAANYRLAVDGYGWGLTRPVFLSAGDTGLTVPLERLLYCSVEVTDIEDNSPVARFTARVLGSTGFERDRAEGRDGKLVYRARHPEQEAAELAEPPPEPSVDAIKEILRQLELGGDLPWQPKPKPWALVIEADGYFPGEAAPSGVQRVALQRVREPNVDLHVVDRDGRPWEEDLKGRFEATEQPLGVADARVTRVGPGRFRAVMPPGAWRLMLCRRGEAAVSLDVRVPAGDTVNGEARLPFAAREPR